MSETKATPSLLEQQDAPQPGESTVLGVVDDLVEREDRAVRELEPKWMTVVNSLEPEPRSGWVQFAKTSIDDIVTRAEQAAVPVDMEVERGPLLDKIQQAVFLGDLEPVGDVHVLVDYLLEDCLVSGPGDGGGPLPEVSPAAGKETSAPVESAPGGGRARGARHQR